MLLNYKLPVVIFLLLLVLISLVFAVTTGTTHITANEVVSVLYGKGSALHHSLIVDLRLPRALAAFASGATLSLAGVLMQVLLRNPLADPYVLGVSGGASFFSLIIILLGVESTWLTAGAFTGALLSIFLVFIFVHGKGSWNITRLLLTGVVLASGWGALISFTLVITPPEKIHSMIFWLMGDLSYDRPLLPAYLILFMGIMFTLPISRQLNVMLWGDLQAGSLGINVNRLRVYLFLLASLLTAGAVTLAGSIGFVGLVVPHLIRLLIGNDHRFLLPASALAGGSLLIIADTLARTMLAPQQIPVGVITALLGVPLFLYLLRRSV
jgi:iron complex transport system permease protein